MRRFFTRKYVLSTHTGRTRALLGTPALSGDSRRALNIARSGAHPAKQGRFAGTPRTTMLPCLYKEQPLIASLCALRVAVQFLIRRLVVFTPYQAVVLRSSLTGVRSANAGSLLNECTSCSVPIKPSASALSAQCSFLYDDSSCSHLKNSC